VDGATVSMNSMTAIEINKALFHSSGASPTCPRNIDLLMRLNDITVVKLMKEIICCGDPDFKATSQNMEANACIHSTLHTLYGRRLRQMLAMDCIEDIGYL
jgi:hypothetical protein